MDGRAAPAEPTAPRERRVLWPVRSGAVPQLADGFISRLETAAGLVAALVPGATVVLAPGRVVAEASGDWLGSSGKTQFAAGFAESLWQSGKIELLVWVDATSRASVLSGYVAAATATASADLAGDAESVAARFVSWLAETGRPWLLVLDDLSDPADLEGLWATGPAGRVLITTASSPALSRDRPELVHPVGVFSPREALSYLMGRLTADTDQRLGAIDLVDDLGCEPLALAQASAVIASSALSCRDYREYFIRRRDGLAGAGGSIPAAAVTWTFSFEQAERLSPGGAAQALLAVAALLDGHGIPAALFATPAARSYLAGEDAAGAVDQARALGALSVLERAGLLAIDRAETPATVRMARVVQAAVRAAMPSAMFERAARAAADALAELWPGDDTGSGLAAAMLRSCAARLQQAAGDLLWSGGCHRLLLRAGQSLDSARLTGPAITYWNDLVATSDRILGSQHPDTLRTGERLAEAYLTAGRAVDAVPWFRWALAKRLRAPGRDPAVASAAQLKLGQALVAARQFRDAITVLGDAVADSERSRGADSPGALRARDELAAAYRAAGQAREAMKLYQQILTDRERLNGARHPGTIAARENLAGVALAEGRVKDAIRHYQKVLADREEVLGPDHPEVIAARGNLGYAYHLAGRMPSALQLYEQACAGYERVLGADHPDTLTRRADLAKAYYAAGRLSDATELLRDTAARCERVLPPGDQLTRSVRESLGNITGG